MWSRPLVQKDQSGKTPANIHCKGTLRPMLNAYVSVCPLPEGSGRLAMGQAQKEKRSNTDSGNRSGLRARA